MGFAAVRRRGKTPLAPRKYRGASENLLHYKNLGEELEYLADNQFIHGGYRANYSWKECVVSLFQMHNETLNVWTHMIGALIFICILAGTWTSFFYHAPQPVGDGFSSFSYPVILAGEHSTPYFMDFIVLGLNAATVKSLASHSLAAAVAEDVANYMPAVDGGQAHLSSLLPSVPALKQRLAQVKNRIDTQKEELAELRKRILARFHHFSPAIWQSATKRLESIKEQIRARLSATTEAFGNGEEHNPINYLSREVELVFSQAIDLPAVAAMMDSAHVVDYWPIQVFVASAIICLSFSSTFHLLYARGKRAYYFLSRLDYAGISVLIAGSFFPVLYYWLYCAPWWRNVYLVSVSSLAVVTFVVSLLPHFSSPSFVIVRALSFVALAAFGIVPFGHMVITYGLFSDEIMHNFIYIIGMAFLYLSGVVIYATKFPECLFPGKFDLLFSSHQLWHLFVVAAALVHYIGALEQYRWRSARMCPAAI